MRRLITWAGEWVETLRIALYPDAGHYENTDDLVTAFPGTLRSWPKVDGGFWLKPVSEPEGLGVWKTWGLSPLMFRGIS